MFDDCYTFAYIKSERYKNDELMEMLESLLESGRKIRHKEELPEDNDYTESDDFSDNLLLDFYNITEEVSLDDYMFKSEYVRVWTMTEEVPGLDVIKAIMDVLDPAAEILYDAWVSGLYYWSNIPAYENCVNVVSWEDYELQDEFSDSVFHPWERVKEAIAETYPDIYSPKMTLEDYNDTFEELGIDTYFSRWIMKDIDDAISESTGEQAINKEKTLLLIGSRNWPSEMVYCRFVELIEAGKRILNRCSGELPEKDVHSEISFMSDRVLTSLTEIIEQLMLLDNENGTTRVGIIIEEDDAELLEMKIEVIALVTRLIDPDAIIGRTNDDQFATWTVRRERGN